MLYVYLALFSYIWVIFEVQVLINFPYMEHMGLIHAPGEGKFPTMVSQVVG
jgi:hypothetical protein